MYPVSAAFLEALRTDHDAVFQVDLMLSGSVVERDIAYTSGEVTVDAGSDVRRSLTLTIPDPAVFPSLPTDPYSVYGHELFVQRGIRLLDGTNELIPQGFFVITEISGDIHTGPLTITAQGREYRIKCAPFPAAATTSPAASASAYISSQLTSVIPGVSYINQSTNGTSGLALTTWDAGSDRWAALGHVAKSRGAELFCNENGSFVLRDIPTTDYTPGDVVWDVSAGQDGVLVSAERSMSIEDVYNHVVIFGENTAAGTGTAPVSAETEIWAPADPLRVSGPLGRRTMTYTSDLVTSEAQAGVLAGQLLRSYRRPNQTIGISCVPNPALDAGDVIRVAYGKYVRPPELFIVQSLTVPLTVDGGPSVITTVQGRASS